MATKVKGKSKVKLTNYYFIIGLYFIISLVAGILGIPASREGASSGVLGATTITASASLFLGTICLIFMFIEFFKKRLNLKGLIVSFIIISIIYLFISTGTILSPFYSS